jgi:hypothetical protein
VWIYLAALCLLRILAILVHIGKLSLSYKQAFPPYRSDDQGDVSQQLLLITLASVAHVAAIELTFYSGT